MTNRHFGAWGAPHFLLVAGVIGVLLALAFPDGYQQDAGHHYLFTRFAADHPESFVGVWNRPLFTALYFLPAQFGYLAAKLFTLAIALGTAWQTYRLADALRVPRAALAIPLLFVQPSFLLLSTETMTEPLFALILVVALRLHCSGRVRAGMLVASLLVLARPEGFVIGLLWGLWVITDSRDGRTHWRRLPQTALLAGGFALWWLAALAITKDPLFILRTWPREWNVSAATYGVGSAWTYLVRLPEITGPALVLAFGRGLWQLLRRRELGALTSSFLVLFLVHSVLRASGWLGSAGYPRYFVCLAPVIAIVTLVGLAWFTRRSAIIAVWTISVLAALLYLDVANYKGRDAVGIAAMKAWFDAHPQAVTRLIWSQAYMAIVFDRNPYESPAFGSSHAENVETLRRSQGGTLVFWDADRGWSRFQLGPDEFTAAGYTLLHSQEYTVRGWLQTDRWLPFAPIRRQQYSLYYKIRDE